MNNRKFALWGILFLVQIGLFAQQNPPVKDYTQYVNPFVGTGALDSLSLSGSNFPGACFPFGLVQLSPDTREYPDDPCSGYDYNDGTILGFSHTHLSGTGCPDLYDFLFMPFGGKVQWNAGSDDGKTQGFRIISGWAKLRKVYFRAEFSRPFDSWLIREGNYEFESATTPFR